MAPPAITAVITEHTTQLQKTTAAVAAAPAPPAPAPGPAPARPHTRARPPQQQPAQPLPADVERTGEIKPARPRGTQRQPTAGPAVRREEPGPVFSTGGQISAVLAAAVVAVLLYGGIALMNSYSPEGPDAYVLTIGLCLLAAGGGLFLLKAITPKLQLKINGDGLLVSRFGLSRGIPWAQIRRVGITGRGKKLALTVWCVDGSPVPGTRVWHRVPGYHGGVRVFPLGATGGWWRRRQETKRARQALRHYAHGRYDDRLR